MKPNEALSLLDRVAASFNGTRSDHAKIQEAIAVLRGLVEGADEQGKTDKNKPASAGK